MERRETRQANQSRLMPEACADGPYKGYIGIDWISEAARKAQSKNERMSHLMHHFNEFNLCEAFRRIDGNKAVGIDQVTKSDVGFSLYWGKSWIRKPILKAKTNLKRLNRCIQDFKVWIKSHRHRYKLDVLWEKAKAKIIGHYNYYGVSHNLGKLNHFYFVCIGLMYKWLNRRSQRKSFTWESFSRRLMFKPIPKPTQGTIVIDLTNGLGSKLKRKPKSRVRKLRTHGSARSNGWQRPLFT